MHSREKARLYHELGQLLRAGFSLPRALEKLRSFTRGEPAAALGQAARALENGGTSAEALAAPAAFGGLDAAIFAASEKSGRLERGLAMAAEYHETMASARSRVMVKVAYPLFMIHFAALTFAVVSYVSGQSMSAFWWSLGTSLGVFWGGVLGIGFLWRSLNRLAKHNVAVDRALSSIPVVGGLRNTFALSRFCLAYDMQLEAGINVFSALETSAAAAGGAAYASAGRRAAQAVRDGEPLSLALSRTGIFPEPVVRAFNVGESTGQLEVELQRIAASYRDAGMRRVEVLVEWLPRAALILVAIYIGFRVINYYMGLFNTIRGL